MVDFAFTSDAIITPRGLSPWKHFDDFDSSTGFMSFSTQRDVVIEIPSVTVPTYVKSIKTRISSTSFQGSVSMFITNFPTPTTGNGSFPVVGTSDSVAMSSLGGSLVTHTFTFTNPVILMPNTRYGIGWVDQIQNSPGLTWGTVLQSTLDFSEQRPRIVSQWREPAIGTPQNFMVRQGQDRTWAVDVEVLNNESGIINTYVGAILVGREDVVAGFSLDWQYRENRISDNLDAKPSFTLTDVTDLELDSNGSVGVGYVFKRFKKSDITGSSITVNVSSGSATLHIQDGDYQRNWEEDFPLGSTVPVTKGIGSLGSLALSTGTNTLSAGSINWAGSTQDEVTIFIRVATSGSVEITSVQIGSFVEYDFQNSVITLEQSGATDVMDYGYFYTSGTSVPFVEKTFTIDARITGDIGQFRDVGDLILRVLQENPPSLTGNEIIDKIREITEVELQWGFFGKTHRIKGWINYLLKEGLIEEDGSDPDWHETNWSIV